MAVVVVVDLVGRHLRAAPPTAARRATDRGDRRNPTPDRARRRPGARGLGAARRLDRRVRQRQVFVATAVLLIGGTCPCHLRDSRRLSATPPGFRPSTAWLARSPRPRASTRPPLACSRRCPPARPPGRAFWTIGDDGTLRCVAHGTRTASMSRRSSAPDASSSWSPARTSSARSGRAAGRCGSSDAIASGQFVREKVAGAADLHGDMALLGAGDGERRSDRGVLARGPRARPRRLRADEGSVYRSATS